MQMLNRGQERCGLGGVAAPLRAIRSLIGQSIAQRPRSSIILPVHLTFNHDAPNVVMPFAPRTRVRRLPHARSYFSSGKSSPCTLAVFTSARNAFGRTNQMHAALLTSGIFGHLNAYLSVCSRHSYLHACCSASLALSQSRATTSACRGHVSSFSTGSDNYLLLSPRATAFTHTTCL
jgi:hypothetical protein